MKLINRPWRPTQSAIRDANGKMIQSKAERKKRWTEYCSSLYRDNDDTQQLEAEIKSLASPPVNDMDDDILYEE